MLRSVDGFLENANSRNRQAIFIFATFLVGVADYFSGPELSFSLFYTGPIMLATWYGKKRDGLVIVFISAVIWLLAEISFGREYSHPLTLLWNAIVRFAFFLLVMGLLLALRDKMQVLSNLASTDPLTGLVNRRFFLEQLERECTRVRRYPEVFSVAYLDLDNFKYVNDSLGHAVGDELLQCVGNVISSSLRQTDLAARLGGDEFAVFFPAMKEENARQVLEKLQHNLLVAMNERQWPVTFSIGVVTYLQPLSKIRDMVKKADDLMYQVKKSGKNNIRYIVVTGESKIIAQAS